MSTNGSGNFDKYNHPLVADGVVGIHNGIITDCYGKDASTFSDPASSDSNILFHHISNLSKEFEGDYVRSLQKVYDDISGSASIAFFVKNLPYLFLASNTGSLYLYSNPESKIHVFFSEKNALEIFLKKNKFKRSINTPIFQISLENSVLIDLNKSSLKKINIRDLGRSNNIRNNYVPGEINVFKNEKSLHRCTKCILPNSYPNIKFDQHGVTTTV